MLCQCYMSSFVKVTSISLPPFWQTQAKSLPLTREKKYYGTLEERQVAGGGACVIRVLAVFSRGNILIWVYYIYIYIILM
jgi:hypothetical protein